MSGIGMGSAPQAGLGKNYLGRYRVTEVSEEVRKLLRDHRVPLKSIDELARMKPSRQIEAANLMVALNLYSDSFVESLVAASRPDQLIPTRKVRSRPISDEQVALMQRDAAELDEAIHIIAPFLGRNHLDLMVAVGYVRRLLRSQLICHHLEQHHAALLSDLQQIALPD